MKLGDTVSLRLTETDEVAAGGLKMEKRGRRGIRGDVSAHWPHCKRIIWLGWRQVESHSTLFRCRIFSFLLPFISSSPLPIPFKVHSQCPHISCLLQVSSGGPRCYLRGVTVESTAEDDGGKMESIIATDSSTSPDGLWRLLSISVTQPPDSFHLWPMATNKRNICGA